MFKRKIFTILFNRLKEKRRFIQVVVGPRQVGKTTVVQQVADSLNLPVLYASADEPSLRSRHWIEQQWELARLEAKSKPDHGAILILDEIQKFSDWSSIIKHLWDQDTRNHLPLKVVLLGSAPLLIQHGLTESLAGRFEQIPATHWAFDEMHQAFNWSLDEYIYFGGYPGAAELINDEERWHRYVNDSLVETTLSRDIILLNPIHKPALLRRLFELSCTYSSQILSYQKMMGQLHDAGNTTTLAHYLDLLSGAGMVTGIHKYSGQMVRQRASSPKLQVLNTAMQSVQSRVSFTEARRDSAFWGRLVESSVGAYLLNSAINNNMKLFYWRDGGLEVDFVLQRGKKLVAIEVKSGRFKEVNSGMNAFCDYYKIEKSLLVGGQNLSVETFLRTPVTHWFD